MTPVFPPLRLAAAIVSLASCLCAQTPLFPLKDLKPGMRGIGKTVFSGNAIEEFQVEILGVLENVGPHQSLILGRLSGGPLGSTGVLQGMSGSPVYVDGKLIGAVSSAFSFAKEPIAGIRPIEEMLRAPRGSSTTLRAAMSEKGEWRLPPRDVPRFAESGMIDIATPVSFGGFTRGTLDAFSPQLRALGLEPRQGVAAGGAVTGRIGNPADLKPGSMISVLLLSGDMNIGADGTVTHIDGNRVFAFGHRFLSAGPTEMPFARAEVLALMPLLSTSFKISAAKELMGVISEDRNAAVAGVLGRRARMIPFAIRVSRAGRAENTTAENYNMEMVDDRFVSPILLQMAAFSAIDATERTAGASTITVRGEIRFASGAPSAILDNIFAGDNGGAIQAALSGAIPLAYILQGGFDSLRISGISLDIQSSIEKKQLQIEQVSAGRREAKPGDRIPITVLMAGENGLEISKTVEYTVPLGAPPGTLFFTVADGMTTNYLELRPALTSSPRSAAELLDTVNRLRPNTKAYIRVWRADPAFQVRGEDFPAPPASLALLLGATQGATQTRNSKVAELEVFAGGMAVSGTRTVQVEVKE